jgi:broad specificity phosphatase PhoE
MLRLYITRHGETEWNVLKRMQGWKDSKLTPKGIENAVALGERLKDVELKSIYSSSSHRTIHTAELIRGNRDITIIPDKNLREINLGEWEGKTLTELEILDNERYKAFWEAPHLYESKAGESFIQVRDRIQEVLNKIFKENPDGNILIVTHGVIVKTIMSIFKAIPLEKFWEQTFINGTSLSIVEINDKIANIVLEGDISHTKT